MPAAAIDWGSISAAAAFVLGAVVATAATLHLVRTISRMFEPRRRPPPDDDADSD